MTRSGAPFSTAFGRNRCRNGIIDYVSIIRIDTFISAKMSDELQEDSAEKVKDSEQEQESVFDYLPIIVIVFLLMLILLILEKVNHKEDRSSNGKRTNRLMIGVIIANATFTLFMLTSNIACLFCPVQLVLFLDSRCIMRWFNLMFLIHRAKLAQGMTPILSKKWFTKILPRIITFIFGLFVLGTTKSSLEKETICKTYNDIDIQQCAVAVEFDESSQGTKGILTFFLGFDLVVTVFLLTLFVVPLYRVYRTDLGALNDNQLRQRRKLRKLLIWSVAMCFINQITSTFFMLPAFGDTQVIWVLNGIGRFDPAINVWTSWLMITRNRQYLRKLLKCSCCRGQPSRSQGISMQSAFTDVSDMQSHSRTHRLSRMFTRTQSKIPMMSSVSDLHLVVEEEPDVQNGPG